MKTENTQQSLQEAKKEQNTVHKLARVQKQEPRGSEAMVPKLGLRNFLGSETGLVGFRHVRFQVQTLFFGGGVGGGGGDVLI